MKSNSSPAGLVVNRGLNGEVNAVTLQVVTSNDNACAAIGAATPAHMQRHMITGCDERYAAYPSTLG